MNKQLVMASLFTLLANSTAYAEPSRSVIYLMNEPLTLWDYGIDRTSESLKDLMLLPSREKYFASVYYVPESNQLTISASPPFDIKNMTARKSKSVKEAKILCKNMIDGIRYELGVDAMKGTASNPYSKYSALCIHFSHDGFKSPNEPSNLCNELDSITTIRAYVETTEAANMIRCEGSLVSNNVLYSE